MPLDWQSGAPAYRVGSVYGPVGALLPAAVVYVGQACDIAAHLAVHAQDHEATYPDELNRPTLHGAWAAVNPVLRDGVEAYVGRRLCPAGTYPDATAVPVTLPVVS